MIQRPSEWVEILPIEARTEWSCVTTDECNVKKEMRFDVQVSWISSI